MLDIMMRLGAYSFGIGSAAYQQFSRGTSYSWPEQSRVGNHAALQFTGFGKDTITLTGRIYPGWRGGPNQIQSMRQQAEAGLPMMLIDGYGFVHGRWVVFSIEEQADTFARAGVPRRQQFTLQMRYYDDGSQVSNA